MFYKHADLIGFHSPMALGDFGNEDGINSFTLEHFFKAVNDEKLEFVGEKAYKDGAAKGIIWGGNLSTIVSLCGQNFIPEKDFLFFTEDLNESVYKIDKMVQQLINIDTFRKNCKAIILGDFLDIDNNEWLDEYFIELAAKLNIPIVSGYKITHDKEKITIPIGKFAILKNLTITI